MGEKYYKEKILEYYKLSEEEFTAYCDKEEVLDKLWYETGESDLSYYEKIEYVAIAYKCFLSYSKTFIKCLDKYFNGEKKGYLDFGAGIGLTTHMLSDLSKDSIIYYQNVEGEQKEFAKSILKGKDNVKFDGFKDVDVILCSELFEHIKDPISLLRELNSKYDPEYLVISNSFRSKAYGHYSEFYAEGENVSNLKIGRLFNKELRGLGYIKDKCFWNGRPTIWKKK